MTIGQSGTRIHSHGRQSHIKEDSQLLIKESEIKRPTRTIAGGRTTDLL